MIRIHYQGTYDRAEVLWPQGDEHFDDVVIHIYGPNAARKAIARTLTTVQLLVTLPEPPKRDLSRILSMLIEELELSTRSLNCLESAGIKTIGDLTKKTRAEMLDIRNFGRRSLNEIDSILQGLDLNFAKEPANKALV